MQYYIYQERDTMIVFHSLEILKNNYESIFHGDNRYIRRLSLAIKYFEDARKNTPNEKFLAEKNFLNSLGNLDIFVFEEVEKDWILNKAKNIHNVF